MGKIPDTFPCRALVKSHPHDPTPTRKLCRAPGQYRQVRARSGFEFTVICCDEHNTTKVAFLDLSDYAG